MEIRITHSAPPPTSMEVPDFPLVRFDTGMVVYQEALINGQYLVADTSARGRPKPREWVWKALSGGADSVRPLRTRQHAFQIEADGQLLVDRWEWVDAHEVDAGQQRCRECVATLRHTQRPITVEVHTRLDDTPFLARWLVITNTSDRHLPVSKVFPWSGQVWEPLGRGRRTVDVPPPTHQGLTMLPDTLFSLGRFVETDAGAEGSFDWMALPKGRYGFETLHGRSGWGHPCFFLRNDVTGEMAVVQFAWSGNWQVELVNDYEDARRSPRDARLYVRVGLAGPAPLRVLEPGESARTPEIHLGFHFGDLDACVQALHTHQRRSVILPQPVGREHRVELNHTGYVHCRQVTETYLREQIDVAADVGAELFTIDGGWFGSASAPRLKAVGDWDQENPLMRGLKTIFAYARSRGLLCGLWVEAERMGPVSQLLRDHPDWQMEKRGEKIPNLDLSRPEVAKHVENTIVGLIEKYELDCYRMDYNISTGEGGEAERGGYTENILWRYYEALYGIFERVRKRFPNLLLENCSSGGGRTDLGMMSRFHYTQVTDTWSPGPQLKIMNGMTIALPPETCMPLLGAISDGVADIDFMLRIGLFGHFTASGIFPTMDERQAAARERWRHAIELYKTFVRPMLSTCRMFHHTPVQKQTEEGDWVVLECASENGERAYVGVFRLGSATGDAYHFYPKGLDVAQRYRLTYDTSGRSREMDGGLLVDQGLRVVVSSPFTSELLLFESV